MLWSASGGGSGAMTATAGGWDPVEEVGGEDSGPRRNADTMSWTWWKGTMSVLQAQLSCYLLQKPSLASSCRGKCSLLHAPPVLYYLGHGWCDSVRCPPALRACTFPRLWLGPICLCPPFPTPAPGVGKELTLPGGVVTAPFQIGGGGWTHLLSLLT